MNPASLVGRATPALQVERLHTRSGRDPLAQIDWVRRDARIETPAGEVVFEQRDVEFPAAWSQTATNVVSERYFRVQNGVREQSVRQVINRVTGNLARWGLEDGYFTDEDSAAAFEAELTHLIVTQKAAFNSPVWFNVGVSEPPQTSACFIVAVGGALEDVLAWNSAQALIFSRGSGAGANLSAIPGHEEILPEGGASPGPLAFMRAADAWAGAVKAGGLKRAAKLVALDVEHPDIRDFIWCKEREEATVVALQAAGFDGTRALSSARQAAFENTNISVRASDAFMAAAVRDAPWSTRFRTTGAAAGAPLGARELLREMASAAWACGDPGIQFDDVINRWHTCPAAGRINASNPCSEYMHVDNSACNLASLNLGRFDDADGNFDTAAFSHAIDILIVAQDILIDRSSYPTAEIARNARSMRQLGLGFTGLGAFLMARGIPYDSRSGRAFAAAIASFMTASAYAQSARLADAMGPYGEFARNREAHVAVVERHREASLALDEGACPDRRLAEAGRRAWREVAAAAERRGFRNAQVTTIAPAGTISLMLDAETTGIEPEYSLVKTKRLAGGGHIHSVARSVQSGLEALGYGSEAGRLREGVAEGKSLAGLGLPEEHASVFAAAVGETSIDWRGHLGMVAAVQPFVSGGISKTVNLASSATVEEIESVYLEAWRQGLKSVSVYRDGSKSGQPLAAGPAAATVPSCQAGGCGD